MTFQGWTLFTVSFFRPFFLSLHLLFCLQTWLFQLRKDSIDLLVGGRAPCTREVNP